MAHIDLGQAQQEGAFTNGAVGSQMTPLCQWPYVWDRVRKACVLPDEWAWAYEDILPYGQGRRWAEDGSLFGYGGPEMGNEGEGPGPIPTMEYGPVDLAGLEAACPEGSSKNASYTGPLDPGGSGCRCAPGRIWLNGRCQSPQSAGQQAGRSLQTQVGLHPDAQTYASQPLSIEARRFIEQSGYSISCKIVKGQAGPQGSVDMMMCSINGGPYEHSAYAINLNPWTALNTVRHIAVAQQVSQATGVAPGSLYSTPELTEALTAAQRAGDQQLVNEIAASMPQGTVPPIVTDTGTTEGGIETLPPPPTGSTPTGDGGYQLPDGSYVPPGTYAEPGGGLGDIPWYLWAALAAGGAYMVMKKK